MQLRGRKLLLVGALAALAAAGAPLFAIVRAHTAFSKLWGNRDPRIVRTTVYGYGAPGDMGRRSRWMVQGGFASVSCTAQLVEASDATDITFDGWVRGRAPWWSFAAEQLSGAAGPLGKGDVVADWAVGWPWPCLSLRSRVVTRVLTDEEARLAELPLGTATPTLEIVHGHRVETIHPGWREALYPDTGAWPTRILWPGLIANAAVLFAVLCSPLVLRAGFVAARAAHRTRRGLCIRCAHSRAGLADEAPCPECGSRNTPHEPRPTARGASGG